MQAGDEWSPRSFQTCIRPSEYCTQNQCSAEKMTLSHFCIQLCRSGHQCRRLSLCCIVKRSLSNSRRVDNPRCCKRLRTVSADTGRATKLPIS
ncbi:hypothetical protein NPIL_162331 [Nephila pilipes]|uniref:Uncharacterized protein n=1 Tax=Nephila pilipes TaxID=299642 RepID=A0A8X6PWS3_NEPPI|nr:hypothetical protein NPIL_162331 [Nephila pilipes]